MSRFTLFGVIVTTLLCGSVVQAQLFDITSPTDPILGVPDDGVTTGGNHGWPGGEAPPLAIDDDEATKYLHFKGEIEPTGIRVTPSQNQFRIVALNFFAANDAIPRDPVSFQLSGSNGTIEGPYEVIAEGTIDEFTQDWARNTWISAPIDVAVKKVYAHYELMFPEVNNSGSANSMQIGEIEFLSDGSRGAGTAGDPTPADAGTDVLRDIILTWAPNEFPGTHNVYFGSNFDDVNDATTPDVVGLDVNSYDVGRLEFGATYYWRVDEVNSSADRTVYKGETWSFEVEPYSIAVPGADIIATSSSFSNEFSMAEKTIDGSGLGEDGTHSIQTEDMWFTIMNDPDPWIQYEFDGVKKLDTMKVWNSNSSAEGFIGYGVNGVVIEYSTDGENWQAVEESSTLSRAPGLPTYNQYDEIAFGGIPAKMVRLSIQSNFGGFLMAFSLSEVQFSVIPAAARTPEPASDATDILPNAVASWRAGREAAQSTVYVSADPNEIADGLAASATSNSNSIDLSSFDLQMSTTYYWRVDEVNNAEAVSVWAGPVWSFTTVDSVIVDDFENYTNDSPDRPFQAWLDGYGYSPDEFFPAGYNGNGTAAGVGHDIWSVASEHYDGDIMETVNTIANSAQSMPFYFNNSGGVSSSTERSFAVPQDWTVGGAQTLSVAFRGTAGNTGTLYVKINNTKVSFDGPTTSMSRPVWVQWPINLAATGANLNNVTEMTIGVDGNGASGMLLIDDIQLYPEIIELPTSFDVTTPGDTVQGVPNDDDWPETEAPGFAIDDNTETKYLHRKGGEAVTGFQVEPILGTTVVTGLTLTTANDDHNRDPITFELSGSNTSIDGPYQLIASGDVVDFAQETSWPRFTKNETPIEFNNATGYKYYQILFPSLRPDNDGLMQISEVELTGTIQ